MFETNKIIRIDVNKEIGVNFIKFSDNSIHANIDSAVRDVWSDSAIDVQCSICSADDLLKLMMTVNALKESCIGRCCLIIPYLMSARYDRKMLPGDSFDLKVIAQIINGFKFDRVFILDPHSDMALGLIHGSTAISNEFLVKRYNYPEAVLICPDQGAVKKVKDLLNMNKNLVEVTYCLKTRDVKDGSLSLKVLAPDKCADRHCVIIDDICDGGATFDMIGEQIYPKTLTLIVTHGIFSRGLKTLEKRFDHIITSDSISSPHLHTIMSESSVLTIVPFQPYS